MKKITLAKSAGFCFGVRRAIELAKNAAKKNKNKKQIYMLGDIVHNPRVVNDIKKNGIKKISKLKKTGGGILIIRAHGAPKSIYKKVKDLGYQIIDATCPMVREIHKIAANYEQKDYRIIIIGESTHDEVKGIKGNLKTYPIIVSKNTLIHASKFKNISKAAVVVQSTQNTETVQAIVKKINKIIPNLIFINTICHPTRQKQAEIKKLAQSQDVMIIIGAMNSANTKRLYEISKKINTHTHWVNSAKDLKKRWFTGKNKVGITAGASTPDHIIEEIQEVISNF